MHFTDLSVLRNVEVSLDSNALLYLWWHLIKLSSSVFFYRSFDTGLYNFMKT